MGKKKKGLDKRGQKIILMVCLSFLLGVIGGAIGANLMGSGQQAELSAFLHDAMVTPTQKQTFWTIFWKYLKYDLLIWVGGWMNMGLFLAGSAFLLRSISLGFASAMMMVTYGTKGVFGAMVRILPQNIVLIPAYLFIMCAAIYYLFSWKEGGGKRALTRERRRKQTEYCILFVISVVLIAVGAGIEILCYPL